MVTSHEDLAYIRVQYYVRHLCTRERVCVCLISLNYIALFRFYYNFPFATSLVLYIALRGRRTVIINIAE